MVRLGILAKQLVGQDFDGSRQPFHRRDLRIASSSLDPTDLRSVNATARGNLFLRQPTAFPSTSKVPPKVARHAGIVRVGNPFRHREVHKLIKGNLVPAGPWSIPLPAHTWTYPFDDR
jgi:hypothetical protein